MEGFLKLSSLFQGTSHKRRLTNCRSRVDAMLECVEKIPQVPTLSIVQQAKNLNIPVWSLQKVIFYFMFLLISP